MNIFYAPREAGQPPPPGAPRWEGVSLGIDAESNAGEEDGLREALCARASRAQPACRSLYGTVPCLVAYTAVWCTVVSCPRAAQDLHICDHAMPDLIARVSCLETADSRP